MSDSILPKIFEGFPELANQAESLESALDALSSRVEASIAAPTPAADGQDVAALQSQVTAFETEHKALREQISALESERAALREAADVAQAPKSQDAEALSEEVAHWKAKYDDLAGRYDADIAAAEPKADTGALEAKDTLIQSLTQAKETAGSEIARLAAALAAAKSDADVAKQQLAEATTSLAKLEGETKADVPDLEGEMAVLKETSEAAQTKIKDLESALKAEQDKAIASQAAQTQASARLSALIETLSSAAKSAGAAS